MSVSNRIGKAKKDLSNHSVSPKPGLGKSVVGNPSKNIQIGGTSQRNAMLGDVDLVLLRIKNNHELM